MKTLLMVLLSLLFIVSIAVAGTVTLTWDAPTTYTDGSQIALDQLGAYKVYYGHASHTYTSNVSVPNPMTPTVTYVLSSLPTGTYFFAVAATDIYGNESDPSNEVSKFVSAGPPSPPTNLIGTVTGVEVV